MIYVGAILLCCSIYGGFRILAWSIPHLAAALRTRGNAIGEEDDILLTHEADPYAAVLDEEHVEDWRAWSEELTAKARKLAEKLDGAG